MVTIYPPCALRPKEVIWYPSRECPECKAKTEADNIKKEADTRQGYIDGAREWIWEKSGIPFSMQSQTFETFDRIRQPKAFERCRKFASAWITRYNSEDCNIPSVILYSDTPGLGKTHLMIAIANVIIKDWTEPQIAKYPLKIKFVSGPGLVRRIRATYNIIKDGHHETEEDIYKEILGCELLMLDDVGKEKPSDFTREMYWYIIDERCKEREAIVMSCRLPMEGTESLTQLMGTDAVDRLYGMTKGEIITLKGKSYRVENRTV